MNDALYIVHAKALPDYFEKVIQAQELIAQKKVKGISEAVEKVGISRSTFYKYKDYIHRYTAYSQKKTAVLSLLLQHEKGILSQVLNILANFDASVLTISQSLPVHGVANVLISLDIAELNVSLDEIISETKKEYGVSSITLVAIE